MAVCTHGSNPNPSYRRIKENDVGKGPKGKLAYETGMASGLS